MLRPINKEIIKNNFLLVVIEWKFLDHERDIIDTTYREGVPEGIAARAFYKHLGFAEGKLTEEFGSPVQEFVLMRHSTN